MTPPSGPFELCAYMLPVESAVFPIRGFFQMKVRVTSREYILTQRFAAS